MLFQNQLNFIDELQDSVFSTLQETIIDNDFVITDFITEKQLYEKGIDGTGNPIKNQQTGRLGYTRTTIRIKKAKGQPTDRITTRDENKFHPSINIDAYPDRFEVSSNVGYAKYLIKRYGENIIRPTTSNMRKFFLEYFIPEFKRQTNDKLTR